MGGASSVASAASSAVSAQEKEEQLQNFLKKESPLQWTPEQVIEWLRLNNVGEEMFPVVSDLFIDGECLSETPMDCLQDWITRHAKGKLNMEQVTKLIGEQVRTHDMVVAFQSTDQTTLNYDEHQSEVSGDAITEQTAAQVIQNFHAYTKNSATGGAPTVKRMWAYQPKITRRYYGCDIHKLIPRSEVAGIDQILYYSLSVSAYQTADQRLMWPRSVSSKRVNPSRLVTLLRAEFPQKLIYTL